MPVGVIVDALAVVIGGIVGAVVGKKLKKDFIDNMNLILGCCSMCMGAVSYTHLTLPTNSLV